MANAIIDYVVRLTENSFGKKGLSGLDYVFGYAKLALMDDGVLDTLFTDKAERTDIEDVRSVFSKKGLDPELLKSGIPLLRENREESENADTVQALFESEKMASVLLDKLLEMDIPELDVMKEGKSIGDVLDLVKVVTQKSSEEKKKKENKAKAAPEPDKKKAKEKGKDPVPEKKEETKTASEQAPKEETVLPDKEKFNDLVKKTNRLYECLKCNVLGQDEAIRLFADGYFQSQVLKCEEEGKKGPSATFLFAGPPGMGKTLLASSVAEILGMKFTSFDMSEFSQEDTVQRLSGVPKTFRYPKAGELTDFVEKNPDSIILLDEIEKAHIDVIYQFLQILDGGVLTDAYTEKQVSFERTLLIFTTNVGKKLYEDPSRRNLSSIPRSVVMKEIENEVNERGIKAFPAAICSRLAAGNVIMLNRLRANDYVNIINKRFTEDAKLVKKLYGYDLNIDSKVAPMLLFSQSTRMDARNMRGQSSILIKNELYDLGRHALNHDNLLQKVDTVNFDLHLDKDEDPYIHSLFVNSEKTEILCVGNSKEFPKEFNKAPLNKRYDIHFTDKEHVLDDIANNDISFILINLKYDEADNVNGYLSLDDIKNDAVVSFDLVTKKVPDMPIYIVHKQDIRDTDSAVFLENGAREFIKWTDDAELADRITQIADMVYMQARVDELSGRGRVLTFNSAQKITKNVANITFYDFKVEVAADADESKMLLSDNDRPKDRFDDVIGAESAKEELKYFVEFLKKPKKFMAQSIKPPKGILLYGPPGTGKTMLARAMAGESDVSFFPCTATAFMDKYVGEGESRIRNIFAVAKKFAPSIIFIDEIDAIGKTRTGSSSTQHTETLLNTLLTEMDGFEFDPTKPVFVVAATNYGMDSDGGIGQGIDPALQRRFDNKIKVDLPKEKEREKFIKLMINKANITTITTNAMHNLAQRTTGSSLAILKNVIELAIRNANKKDVEIDDKILLDALEEYMYGEKQDWDEEYYKSVAIHESGHAYVSYVSGEKPSFVTIVSRGDFGGYMQHANQEKTPSYSKDDLIWRIRVSLAGRVAETEFFGDKGVNTGISSDIRSATGIAFDIIYRYAMTDETLASIPIDKVLESDHGSEALAQVNEILAQEMKNTEEIVKKGKKYIKKLADFLVKNNQATEKDIVTIFEGVTVERQQG